MICEKLEMVLTLLLTNGKLIFNFNLIRLWLLNFMFALIAAMLFRR